MKKINTTIKSNKAFKYAYWALFAVFCLLCALLADFINKNAYEAIHADGATLLMQRPAKSENLNINSLDEVLEKIKNKPSTKAIADANDLFD